MQRLPKEATAPLLITKVEQLAVYTNVPTLMEIVGSQVIEVASDLIGRQFAQQDPIHVQDQADNQMVQPRNQVNLRGLRPSP